MQTNPNRVENKLHPFYQIIPIKFDHEANVGPIQINLHRFDLSWKRQWNQNIVIFLLPASVSITMMLFLLYLWHRITFWRWSSGALLCLFVMKLHFEDWVLLCLSGFCSRDSFCRIWSMPPFLPASKARNIIFALFPKRTSVPIYIWWSFYFYGGKEQL